MSSELFHLEKQIDENETDYLESSGSWINVMPNYDDEIQYDDDCPAYNPRYAINPVLRLYGRIVPPRKSASDPIDPEVVAFMKSMTPLIQMRPDILDGMPVFKNTLVPIKRMFDYLLSGQTMSAFIRDFPTVSRDTAVQVLENDATLFYEKISKALDHN